MGNTDLPQIVGELEYKSFANLWANLSETTVPISTHQLPTKAIEAWVCNESLPT